MLVHRKMVPNAYVAETLDGELGGLPASHEFLGFHGPSQVSVL
jgi:hypothetical protein